MGVLEGKIAIVTGAATGIGREIAVTLGQEGATVVIADVNRPGGEDAAKTVKRDSPRSIFYEIDITDFNQIKKLVHEVNKTFGSLDILVNNAGVTRKIDFFDVTPQELDWIFNVNTKAAFLMMQAAAAEMKRTGTTGRIVNIASIAGKGYHHTSNIAYAGSKGALIAMTRVAAVQLAPFGITVNSICPGLTETEMMAGWIEKRAAAAGISIEAQKAELVKDIPLRRTNTARDIASGVLFMVSPQSRNVTGQSLNVDGGLIWD